MHLVLVSTFPPRRCGLASYTSDLSAALRRVMPHWRVSVCATDRGGLSYAEPTIRIDQDEPRDYVRPADVIAAVAVARPPAVLDYLLACPGDAAIDR